MKTILTLTSLLFSTLFTYAQIDFSHPASPIDYQFHFKTLVLTDENTESELQDAPSWKNGPLVAEFNYTINCLNVVFENKSDGAISYSWDFGDNTTSEETSPVHIYPQTGNYFVTLNALDENGNVVSHTKELSLNCATTVSNLASQINITAYPNPAQYQLHFQCDGLTSSDNYKIRIHNYLGQQIKLLQAKNGVVNIPLHNWPVGTYFYQLIDQKNQLIYQNRFVVGS